MVQKKFVNDAVTYKKGMHKLPVKDNIGLDKKENQGRAKILTNM